MLDDGEIRRRTTDIIQRFDVRPPNPDLPARALSGGNQQKLIIGREFELNPKLLLVSQPTRGVDIGAIEFIHREAREAARCRLRGAAGVCRARGSDVAVRPAADYSQGKNRRRSESENRDTRRSRIADDEGPLKLVRELFFPVVAVLAAFVVGGVFILAIGESPLETYRLMIGSALWWPDGIGYTLFLATPLIFTGLAVSVAFRAGLLNIGAEGQLYVAAFATAWVGIVFANLPAVVLVPHVLRCGDAGGRHLGRDSRNSEGAVRIA